MTIRRLEREIEAYLARTSQETPPEIAPVLEREAVLA